MEASKVIKWKDPRVPSLQKEAGLYNQHTQHLTNNTYLAIHRKWC